MKPGTYHITEFVQGDTFLGRDIATLSIPGEDADTPIAITSGVMEILSNKSGELIYRWTTEGASPNAAITGADLNTFQIHPVPKSITALWPVGSHTYGVKLTTEYGDLTFLSGKITVAARPTTPTS